MQKPAGTFIVLEGADGSGKGTQFRLLTERLKAVGYEVEVFDFPQYESGSSYFVKKYLNGELGSAKTISPYTASLFFALDRYDAAERIKEALRAGKVVLSNRYVGSNMAHQGSKFHDPIEQRGFFVWEDSLEFQLLGLPRPSINIFLKVPADISYELIVSKAARNYTDKKRDEHEADIEHLRNSVKAYDLLCELFPNDFKAINCVANDKLMSIPEINNLVWEQIQPLLPPKPDKPGKAVTIDLSTEQPNTQAKTTEPKVQSGDFKISTKVSLLVYEEIREFTANKRFVIDWKSVNYAFYTPPNLQQKTSEKYHDLLTSIISTRQNIDKKIRSMPNYRELIAPSTPLCALIDVEFILDQTSARELLRKLSTTQIQEARDLAARIAKQAKSSWPKQFNEASLMNEPEQLDKIINRLVREQLPQNLSANNETIKLLSATPRNEFKVLIDIIYPKSELPREDLELEIDQLNYSQKVDLLTASITGNNSAVQRQLSYNLDITAERSTMFALNAVKVPHLLKPQSPTPRFGYDVPAQVEEAGLVDEYLDIFDKSLELYSMLQTTNRPELAAYGVMIGHKSRFNLTCSLEYLIEARKELHDQAPLALITDIVKVISNTHPIVGEVLERTKNIKPRSKKRRNKKRK